MSRTGSGNDFERRLSTKNVRNARSDFMAARHNIDDTTMPVPLTGNSVSSQSDFSSTDNLEISPSTDNIDITSVHASPLDDEYQHRLVSSPSSRSREEPLYDNGPGLGSAAFTETESFIAQRLSSRDEDNSNSSCCFNLEFKKYKGIWFLLFTVVVLIVITTGICIATDEDDSSSDDDKGDHDDIPPAPAPAPTLSPTIYADKSTFWCGVSFEDASQECSTTCSETGLDSECPAGLLCFSGVTACGTYYCATDELNVFCDQPCVRNGDCSLFQNCLYYSECDTDGDD